MSDNSCFVRFGRFGPYAGMLVLVLGIGDPLMAQSYTPLFSQEMLGSLDAAARERFAVLEGENYQRWRNRNPQAPDVAAVRRQHEQTEAVLRRIRESRDIKAEARRRNAPGARRSERQKRDCAAVSREIEELSGGGAFYEKSADGEKRYLSDKEIAERVKSQQKSYKQYCKS